MDQHGGTPLAWAITMHPRFKKDPREATAALLSHGANTDFVFKPWDCYTFDTNSILLLESVREATKSGGKRCTYRMERREVLRHAALGGLEENWWVYRNGANSRSKRVPVDAVSKGVGLFPMRTLARYMDVTNIVEQDTTPLLYAMKFRPLDIVKLMLDNGASVDFVAQVNAKFLSAVLAHKDEALTKIIGDNFKGKHGLRAEVRYHIDSIFWRIATISI